MEQAVQVAASLCIVVPFILVQLERLSPKSSTYAALNLIGSATLAVDAAHGRDWGFLLLEATWALVSLLGLIRALSKRVTGAGRVGRPGEPSSVVSRSRSPVARLVVRRPRKHPIGGSSEFRWG